MKNLKIILLTFIGLTLYTCDLEEDPIFLDAEATYAVIISSIFKFNKIIVHSSKSSSIQF